MTIEQNIKAALLAHAQLLVEQQRVKEARQPDNWSVLIDAMMQWEPFCAWVAAGQLTHEQMEFGLQEALAQYPAAWHPNAPITGEILCVQADRLALPAQFTLRLHNAAYNATILYTADPDRPFERPEVVEAHHGKIVQAQWAQWARPGFSALISVAWVNSSSYGAHRETVAQASIYFVEDAAAHNKDGVRPMLGPCSPNLCLNLRVI